MKQSLKMKQLDEIIKTQLFINGNWVDGEKGTTFDVVNPATGELIRKVAEASPAQVKEAIDAAHSAFPAWSKKTAGARSVLLRNWFNLIIERKEALATLMTMECGKPYKESLGEVVYGAGFIEWFAEEGKRAYGDVIPSFAEGKRVMVIRQPVGVAAAITPWNFPLAMVTRKLAPALAAGCTSVLKPPSPAPLTSLAIAALASQAGIPAGVLNVVTGTDSATIGKEFCTNDKIRKLSFTGSTEVGRTLLEACAADIKKVSMELGGNAPLIVFEDADLDAAVEGAIASKYRNSGQTCVCVNRILAHDKIYDEFLRKLVNAVQKLKTGNGLDEDVSIGPLINKKGLEKVQDLVQDALVRGGSLLTGGKTLGGLFYQPTVIGDANPSMRLAQEEIFGPVAPVFRFSSESDALRMANDTIFGLASYFYSRDVSRCWRVAEGLEYGMVGINTGLISSETAPFGGVKQSGLGREGSKYGLDEYMELKYLCYGEIN
ncbi:MAG TPA: NAD-dependent succinate-semialdehyde dehydrogenase [Flavitalea sp.]|nr:NAD-dependent succinate-semialdehyde dehydrogenase [Flavitalea sp.]